MLVVSGLVIGAASPIAAQETSLWLDGGDAYARPPAGAPGDAGDYATLSALLKIDPAGPIAVDALGYGGWSLGSSTGDWIGGTAGVDLGGRPAPLRLGARFEVSGLRYRSPFRYSTGLATVRPFVAGVMGRWDARLELTLSRGRWSGEAVSEPITPPGPPVTGNALVSGDLSIIGGSLELARSIGPLTVSLDPEIYDSRNGEAPGTYGSGEVAMTWESGPLSLRAAGGVSNTPGADIRREMLGTYETTLAAALGAGVVARVSAGRDARDPVYGAPGTFGFEIGLSWKVPLAHAAPPSPVAKVGRPTQAGRPVRFRLSIQAQSVELAGDFDAWNPEPMRREGNAWVLEKVLPPGLYHFAFRVNGERWMVPEGAPGVTDDGWGKPTASIVIERM